MATVSVLDRPRMLEEFVVREALGDILRCLTVNFCGFALLDERTADLFDCGRRDGLFRDAGYFSEVVSSAEYEALWPSTDWPDGPECDEFFLADSRAMLLAARVFAELAARPEAAARAAAALTDSALRTMALVTRTDSAEADAG